PTEIGRCLEKMDAGKKTVLLECISNLAANEMFAGENSKLEMQVVQSVISGLEKIKENTTNLVVVSNNVFEDGIIYDQTTMDYIHAMGEINQRLAAMADQVVEVVAGIPVVIKQ
ncbi:MAG: bifunctional adenosylcobinamide kinase/adenosylcobinamide-phosphate guanylyltransferase, partial [Lachnospiraceae bacterium]|nr:bifunctional adenosylcobinamide kinase/adenosylcobinamide-phosphate guanylyltransferase [Lachnospiraceae bacterium]